MLCFVFAQVNFKSTMGLIDRLQSYSRVLKFIPTLTGARASIVAPLSEILQFLATKGCFALCIFCTRVFQAGNKKLHCVVTNH